MEKPATFAEILRRSQRKQGIEPEMPVNMYPSFRRARLNSKQRFEPEMPVNMYPSVRRARLKSNPNADPKERPDAVDIEEITPLVYDQQSVISRKSQKSAGNNDFDGKSVASKASQIRKQRLLAEMEAEEELDKIEMHLELEKKKMEMQLEMQLEMQKRAVQRKFRLRMFDIRKDLESKNHSIDGRLPEETVKSDHGVDKWLNQCNPDSEKTKDSKKISDCTQNTVNQKSCCGDIAYLLERQTMEKDLTYFNGNPAEWPSFISEFRKSIKECEYTNLQNLYRLRKCLKGDAMDLVSYMFDVPHNVDMILETLEMDFGCPEYIIDVLTEKTTNVQSPKEENVHSLILFSNPVFQNDEDMDLFHNMVKHSFSTETFGVRTTEKVIQSKEIERAGKILAATTQRVGIRWETSLLWKSDSIQFPESKKNAIRRMFTMEKQMDNCKEFSDQYCATVEEYFQKRFVTKLNEDGKSTVNHFGVFNPNKPGKLRLVYDAAAKANGLSFNDAPLKGPDMLNSLPAVLLKFRERKIAFTGAITDMFCRVVIRPEVEDQFVRMFLWRGMKRTDEPKRWRISQRLADHFWKRWVKEYLPTLTKRTKWLRETNPIEIGDIVIIVDPDLPRNVLPKGRVVNTIPGKDNVIRVVDVKTQHGILRRTLLKIYVMDVGQKNCEEPEILHGEEYVPEERIS